MKKKIIFYGLLMMMLVGSVSFTEMKSTKAVDALIVSSSTDTGEAVERPAGEKREEGYEAAEAIAEREMAAQL